MGVKKYQTEYEGRIYEWEFDLSNHTINTKEFGTAYLMDELDYSRDAYIAIEEECDKYDVEKFFSTILNRNAILVPWDFRKVCKMATWDYDKCGAPYEWDLKEIYLCIYRDIAPKDFFPFKKLCRILNVDSKNLEGVKIDYILRNKERA